MVMSNFKKLALLPLFLFSASVYSDEIEISSIQSSEGASLNCDASNDLTLYVMGGTQQLRISAIKKEEYIYLTQTNIKYNLILTPETAKRLIPALENISHIYFINGKPLSGPAFIQDDLEYAQNSYDLLKLALNEAHEIEKCLDWDL